MPKAKLTPEAVLSPILERWSTLVPGVVFEIQDDADDVVIIARVLGCKPATARIRREHLEFGSEEIAAHASRVIGTSIGAVI